MSPTLHELLYHAVKVVAEAIIPIGQLSKEAAEARYNHSRVY